MTAKSQAAAVKTPAPEAAPRRKQKTPARRPRVSVVGSDELLVRRVARQLDRLRVNVVIQSWEEVLETLQADLAALVLVEPIRKVANRTALEIIRDHPDGKAVPIFFVVPDATSSTAVRRLYSAGATTVFNWPRESKILATLFAEAFGIVRVRGRSSHEDKTLTRSVRAHLRIAASAGGAGLRLFSRDGLVSVSGQVNTLAQRGEIIETIAAVPGVRAVIGETLRVRTAAVSSRVLSRRIRSLMEHTVDLDPTTLAVTTRHGKVTLSGTAADRAEVQRLENLISNLKGVRELQSNIDVGSDRQRRDSRVARRLEKVLDNLYPKERLTLAVFDGIAVISGRVRHLGVKRSLERLLQRDTDIRRVVNKVEVKPRSRSRK